MEPLDDDPELSFDNEEYKELTRDVVNKQQSTGPILQDEEDNNFDDQSRDMEKLIPDENMNTIVTRQISPIGKEAKIYSKVDSNSNNGESTEYQPDKEEQKANTQSTTFLPDINSKSNKFDKKDIAELDAADAECLNQLDMMEQTIEKTIVQVNRSSIENPLEQSRARITALDLHEMESFNNAPREKLGGMSLSMIYNNKLQSQIVQEMVQNSKTLQLLKKYNDGQVIEETKKKVDNRHMQEFDASAKNQAQNKSIFLQKYGFECEIPTYYLINAKIYPKNPKYSLKVIKYVIPDSNQDVYDLKDGQITKTKFTEIYEDCKYCQDDSVLQLIQIEENRITVLNEVKIENSLLVDIAFSPDGKYFALFRKSLNILQIYSCGKITDMMKKVEQQQYFKQFENLPSLKECQKLYFDRQSRYLVSYGDVGINIIDLEDQLDIPHYQMIDKEIFKRIVDLQFVSTKHGSYRCDLMCQRTENQILQICKIECFDFDPRDPVVDSKRQLSYLNPDTSELQVKISQDFESIMVTNGDENYYFSREKSGDYFQRGIPTLNKKNLNFILSEGNHFYFITSKDFDDNMKVELSNDETFERKIPKKIQPGILKVHDVVNQKGQMIILDSYGEQFNIEIVTPESEGKEPMSIHQDYYNQRIMWPFVVQQGFRDYFWIIDAFNPEIIHRIFLPGENFMLQEFFIYDFRIFFVVMSEVKKCYQMWSIDLRCTKDQFELVNHFQYSFDSVEQRPFLDFFVRGESRDRDQQKNLKLIVFFLHEGKLFHWMKGMDLKSICSTPSDRLQFLSKNEFVFRDDYKSSFCLKKIQIMFSHYQTHKFFEEMKISDCAIKAYAFDQEAMMLLTLNKVGSRKNYKQRLIKIFDLKIGKQLISFNTVDDQIIGRLTSGLFHIVNGHLYFGNQVIKIRYDLVRKSQTTKLNEKQIFDKYDHLLEISGDQKILAENPIVCVEFHRMAYFSINFTKFKPKKLTVIPYMHERKIYLNKQKQGNSYFYTTINELPEDKVFDNNNQFINNWRRKSLASRFIVSMDMDRHIYYVMNEKGILLNKVDFNQHVAEYGTPIQVSPNGKNFIFQDKKDKFKINILCLGSKELIFVKTINISQSVSQYILDYELQEDQTIEEKRLAKKLRVNYDGDFRAYFISDNVNLHFSINDNLDIAVQLTSKQEDCIRQELEKAFNSDDIPTLWQLFNCNDEEMRENHKVRLSQESKAILKNMQPILKMRIKASIQASKGSIFYIQKAVQGLQEKKLSVRQLSFFGKSIKRDSKPTENQLVFFTRDYNHFIMGQENKNFILNSQYLICWNHFSICTLDLELTYGINKLNLNRLNFEVDPLEKQTFIKQIRTGSNPNFIMVVVKQSQTSDFVLHWDLQKDVEICSFESKSDPIIFFDGNGDPYITEDQQVIICKQNLGLLAFDVKKANEKNQKHCFGYHYGHRFDDVNHNWILFNEYISLSFSYMTLVMRDMRQQKSKNYLDIDYVFDQEEYNFVLNRKTCFTCDNFVGNNYEKLQFVLKNMMEENKILLQQLYYYYLADPKVQNLGLDPSSMLNESSTILNKIIGDDENEKGEELKITPLHLAFFEGNNRSINLILKYMSFLPCDCSYSIKDILPSLINQENFLLYMQELPFRTIQMENKQTLKVKRQFNDQIVQVQNSCSGYTDDLYFSKFMKEDKKNKNFKNFPVNIWALKCNWIIDSEEGNELLEQLLLSEKHELFDCRTIKVIVEFLYLHYRKLIIYQRLPVYIFQLIAYFSAVLLNELSYTNDHNQELDILTQQILNEKGIEGTLDQWKEKIQIHDHIKNTSKYAEEDRNPKPGLLIFFAILNLLSCIYSLSYIVIQSKKQFNTFYKSIWAYFDIFYVIINGLISIAFLRENTIDVNTLRQIEAVLCVIIVGKLVYFTQLIDEIAPLINIIIQIFYDIAWFCFIMIVVLFCFANSFYLIGQNQNYEVYLAEQKQRISDLITGETSVNDELQIPRYFKFHGALRHVYLLALGEFELDDYEIGDGSDNVLLWIFFLSASFFLLIHLLNMLIAIMGETFTKYNEIKHQQTIRNHLRFVIDNQWRDPLDGQRSKITYLITAFLSTEDHPDTEVLHSLVQDMGQIKSNIKSQNQKLMYEIQMIKTQIENLSIAQKP